MSSFGSQQTKFIVAHTRPVSSCCSQIAAEGKLKTGCKVEFFEMGINALDLTPGAASVWPSSALKVSGAVCCYDAGRKETLKGLENCIGMSSVWGVCVYHETISFVHRYWLIIVLTSRSTAIR